MVYVYKYATSIQSGHKMLFEKNTLSIIHIIFIFTFSCCTSVAAEENEFINELNRIKSISDTHIALSELLAFEKNKNLTISEQAEVLYTKADMYLLRSDFENSLTYFKHLQVFAFDNHLAEKQALALKFMGVNYYYTGKNKEAIAAYLESAKYFSQKSTPVKHANLLNNIALCHEKMGDTYDALDYYKKAEALYIKYGTLADRIDVKGNISQVYMRVEQYDVAIEGFLDVLEEQIGLKDDAGIAITYSSLGVAYKKAQQFDKGLEYTTKALVYYQLTNKKYFIASELHNLSELYNELNKPTLAIKYAKEAIELAELTENKYAQVGAFFSYSFALFHLERADEALLLLNKSQEISEKMEYSQQVISNLALYSLIYAYQKNTSKALSTQKKYSVEVYKRLNGPINKKISLFESEKLKEKVKNLEHKNVLQELKNQKDSQQRSLIVVIVLFVLATVFYFYRRSRYIESQEELASKIKKRTHELETLTKELKLANEVKSQFLANMSHEIRTPLTAVIGQSEAIISGEVEEKHISDEVAIIHTNSLHVLELINNILDLSKIEANKLELDAHHQDLHTVFIELHNMFAEQAKFSGLTFTVNHGLPTPFIINIDAFRLKQILINLCSNALKFTHKGEVVLSTTVTDESLIFTVSDTGIGMSDTQLNDIFTSFTQGDSSISRRFGGSGLGLSLSEQLASLMGGDIIVESELNKGSVFTLTLPCSYTFDEDQTFEMKEVVDHSFTVFKNKCNGQVILADDHLDNLRLISRILTTLGLEVFTASNGKEAVELFELHSPRLILLDIQMPEMDGIEAFHLLRQKGCNVPILALTANAMSHEVDEYLSIGFDGHLKKPIERGFFIDTVVQYCCDELLAENLKEKALNIDTSDLVIQFKSNLVLEQQDIILHLNNQDYEKLALLAHRIAGAGQMFGFAELSEKAIAVEYVINNKFTNVPDFTQYLLNEIDSVLW